MSQHKKSDRPFTRALTLWEAPANAGEPRVCVATTFTFDATFFETDCLGRFLQMESHPGESASVAYLVEREEKLAAARVCVLVDRRHATDKESLRWDVLGVSVPHASQHAKVSLLLWHHHLRVIIASANLKQPGYRKNVEVFGTFDLAPDSGDAEAMREILGFIHEVGTYAVGRENTDGPRRRLHDTLASVANHVEGWGEPGGRRSARATPVFGSPARSVIETVGDLWVGPPARQAYVLSPYFDGDGGHHAATTALISLLAKNGHRSVCFDVRTEVGPEGGRRVRAPRSMIELAAKTADVAVRPVLPAQEDELRDLHAKMMYLCNDSHVLVLMGSSNFTTAGLGAARTHANLEANIVYRLRSTDRELKRLDQAWPELGAPFDWKSPGISWEPEDEGAEDGADESPLPLAFEDAVFDAGAGHNLSISLGTKLPSSWAIRVPAGRMLLTSAEAGPRIHTVAWTEDGVPIVLEVSWTSSDGPHMSNWPVNVANPSTLPPPDVLRHLTLDELIEILASTRPLPQAVAEVLQRREGKTATQDLAALDPLKRYDSQEFLLRRARRVALALERLRERLERPVFSLEAFDWRLSGPVGPVALAEAFVRESRVAGEASFCLAELALTLRRVRAEMTAAEVVPEVSIRSRLQQVISEVRARTEPLQAGPQLAAYVTAAFAEAES